MGFKQQIKLLFDSHIPLVNVITYEESRAIDELRELFDSPEWPTQEGLITWDIGAQFVTLKAPGSAFDAAKPATAETILRRIHDYKGSATFVLKDFHQIWKSKQINIRMLRNLAATLPETTPRKNIVITTPEPCLPDELKHDIPILELPKPTADEIDRILERTVGRTGALDRIPAGLRAKILEAALGLSSIQARRVFLKAVIQGRSGVLDEHCIDLITEEKRAIIRESGALEYYPHAETLNRVGGLDELKKWLENRRLAFSEEAHGYGLPQPRGVALIGIPGTGKSLCAKVTAGIWKLPLLRLDMGAVFGGTLGSSEKNIREAMQISEVIAPCVLWVDEIEKAFAGSMGDSGTASRVLATFLTWMQEKAGPVFVFATANDIGRLPPEFLRKGRFDEVFFLDLPTAAEREAIVEVHLKQKGRTMVRSRFDLPAIAEATRGFVGAELEAVTNDALFPAFMDGQRELETEDLLRSAGDMVPLARSHEERIDQLRTLVRSGLARNASTSTPDREVAVDKIRNHRVLDMPED